jgi:hypothetical protein
LKAGVSAIVEKRREEKRRIDDVGEVRRKNSRQSLLVHGVSFVLVSDLRKQRIYCAGTWKRGMEMGNVQ